MFHNHKFGKVESDGFQYCEKCGLAVCAEKHCDHSWECLDEYAVQNVLHGNTHKVVYVMQCKNCGELKKFDCCN